MESNTTNKEITIDVVREELPSMKQKIDEIAGNIVDQKSYEDADEFLVQVKLYRKRVDEAFKKPILRAREALESIRELKRQVDDPLSVSEKVLKDNMAVYYAEAEKKRREEEARRMSEIKKREEEARLAEAKALEEAGEGEAADAVMDEPLPAPAVNLPKTQAKGTAMTEHWSASVVNMKMLIVAIMSGQADISLVVPNQQAINQMARALKGRLSIPGIRATMRYVASTRIK